MKAKMIKHESPDIVNKPLVYIDQNVIGLQLEGAINLINGTDLCWVYSKEHFKEIRRSDNPAKYLNVLESLSAKLLDLELGANLRITGNYRLIEDGTPMQHYRAYRDSNNDFASADNLFDPIQAYINGGKCEDPLRQLPDRLREHLRELHFPLRMTFEHEFNNAIVQIIDQNNDIKKTRETFGGGNNVFGDIKGDNQLKQIWNIVKPLCLEKSSDQFFGFDPIDKQGYEKLPIFLGIMNCCAILDVLGFQSEKKCRKLEKIPNVRSDSSHIGMSVACSALLTEDERLVERAKAIYDYKNIKTIALHLRKRANKQYEVIVKNEIPIKNENIKNIVAAINEQLHLSTSDEKVLNKEYK